MDSGGIAVPGAYVKHAPASSRSPNISRADLEAIFGGPVTLPPARTNDRDRLFHGKGAEHLWCSQCARAFPNGAYRQVGEVRRCPYAGCDAHATVDALAWERVKATSPDYPGIPMLGTCYPRNLPPAVPREMLPAAWRR